MTKEFEKIDNAFHHFNKANKAVSNRAVDWHLDHVLRITVGVISALKKSDSLQYKSSFNMKRLIILSTGYIPRGKVKAPKHVNKLEQIDKTEVISFFEKTRLEYTKLNEIPKNAYFEHPFLGQLNKKQTLRFLKVHTNHHLKIIDDIITSK